MKKGCGQKNGFFKKILSLSLHTKKVVITLKQNILKISLICSLRRMSSFF